MYIGGTHTGTSFGSGHVLIGLITFVGVLDWWVNCRQGRRGCLEWHVSTVVIWPGMRYFLYSLYINDYIDYTLHPIGGADGCWTSVFLVYWTIDTYYKLRTDAHFGHWVFT